jgi:hypothetical protein
MSIRISTVFEKNSRIEVEFYTNKKVKYILYQFLAIEYEGRKCLLGMGLDLTDRKKSEEVIKKANERFERISSATNDAIRIDFSSEKLA